MKVSIITVNLNNKEGLIKTINSVVCQHYDDFEFIIVDGASTDGSIDVIKELETSNKLKKRFRWISEKDTGIYEAMNKGIKMATGEYLLFLNSGDFLTEKNVLDVVFSSEHNADFLLGRCNMSRNGIVEHTTPAIPEKITLGFVYMKGISHQSTFIKKQLFLQYGYYREDFRYNSDIEFWYRTIVFSNCTTEPLSSIITDYDLGGMSSTQYTSVQYQKEITEIYSHPLLQLVLPDYDEWIVEKNELKILFWARSKKLIYNALTFLYKLVFSVSQKNNIK